MEQIVPQNPEPLRKNMIIESEGVIESRRIRDQDQPAQQQNRLTIDN